MCTAPEAPVEAVLTTRTPHAQGTHSFRGENRTLGIGNGSGQLCSSSFLKTFPDPPLQLYVNGKPGKKSTVCFFPPFQKSSILTLTGAGVHLLKKKKKKKLQLSQRLKKPELGCEQSGRPTGRGAAGSPQGCSPGHRHQRPPLRRCSAASAGSWRGAAGRPVAAQRCRTAWRRCGGGGGVSRARRGCAVRREPSQVRGGRAEAAPLPRFSRRAAGGPLRSAPPAARCEAREARERLT